VKEMSATINIDAPPMDVWSVLTDLSQYPDWNPLFREATGEIAIGKRIRLRSVHPANGRLMTVKPKIVTAEPGVELRWASSLPGIISGEHSFRLSVAEGGTTLVQSEAFRGLLVPFSGKILSRSEASFQSLNEAIKKRVEQNRLLMPLSGLGNMRIKTAAIIEAALLHDAEPADSLFAGDLSMVLV
jgi:hypothetical protein